MDDCKLVCDSGCRYIHPVDTVLWTNTWLTVYQWLDQKYGMEHCDSLDWLEQFKRLLEIFLFGVATFDFSMLCINWLLSCDKQTHRPTLTETSVDVSSQSCMTVTTVWADRVDTSTTETQARNHFTFVNVYTTRTHHCVSHCRHLSWLSTAAGQHTPFGISCQQLPSHITNI